MSFKEFLVERKRVKVKDLQTGKKYRVVSYMPQVGSNKELRGKEFDGTVERFIFQDDDLKAKVFFEGNPYPYLLRDLEIIKKY